MSKEERIGLLEREVAVTKVVGLSLLAQTQLLELNRTSLYYQPAPASSEELRLKRRIDEIYTTRLTLSTVLDALPPSFMVKAIRSTTKLWLGTCGKWVWRG